VIQKLWEVTGGDAFVTSDVGQHQMWAAQYYKFDKPRRWINSGGLGTMGFGLPSAMGVQLAIRVAGGLRHRRGSIQMNIQELATCKQFRLPIKVVMLNNRYLGMVRQWQEIFHGNRYSESYMDRCPISPAGRGLRPRRHPRGQAGRRGGALREAFSRKNDLVFLDFQVDQTENVYPMVQGGKGSPT
jgi:acetolactate synthase-1/2/3 large subunit